MRTRIRFMKIIMIVYYSTIYSNDFQICIFCFWSINIRDRISLSIIFVTYLMPWSYDFLMLLVSVLLLSKNDKRRLRSKIWDTKFSTPFKFTSVGIVNNCVQFFITLTDRIFRKLLTILLFCIHHQKCRSCLPTIEIIFENIDCSYFVLITNKWVEEKRFI